MVIGDAQSFELQKPQTVKDLIKHYTTQSLDSGQQSLKRDVHNVQWPWWRKRKADDAIGAGVAGQLLSEEWLKQYWRTTDFGYKPEHFIFSWDDFKAYKQPSLKEARKVRRSGRFQLDADRTMQHRNCHTSPPEPSAKGSQSSPPAQKPDVEPYDVKVEPVQQDFLSAGPVLQTPKRGDDFVLPTAPRRKRSCRRQPLSQLWQVGKYCTRCKYACYRKSTQNPCKECQTCGAIYHSVCWPSQPQLAIGQCNEDNVCVACRSPATARDGSSIGYQVAPVSCRSQSKLIATSSVQGLLQSVPCTGGSVLSPVAASSPNSQNHAATQADLPLDHSGQNSWSLPSAQVAKLECVTSGPPPTLSPSLPPSLHAHSGPSDTATTLATTASPACTHPTACLPPPLHSNTCYLVAPNAPVHSRTRGPHAATQVSTPAHHALKPSAPSKPTLSLDSGSPAHGLDKNPSDVSNNTNERLHHSLNTCGEQLSQKVSSGSSGPQPSSSGGSQQAANEHYEVGGPKRPETKHKPAQRRSSLTTARGGTAKGQGVPRKNSAPAKEMDPDELYALDVQRSFNGLRQRYRCRSQARAVDSLVSQRT